MQHSSSTSRHLSPPTRLSYAEAVHHNSHQFFQSLLIALSHVFLHYQDHDHRSRPMRYQLDLSSLDADLKSFAIENIPDFRCDIIEYAGKRFICFRSSDGLSEALLARSLNPRENWEKATEVTGGSSGSFVLKTSDESIIVKAITVEEATILLDKILPKWDATSDVSVMCRVYGVFSVRMPGIARVFLLIMNNLTQVPKPMYAVFDLKGSRFNRQVLKNPCRDTPLVQSEILKDRDFHEMVGRLSLSESDKDRLWFSVYSDVSLLNHLQLMDYSLLIGIGECSSTLSSLPKRFQRNLFSCTNAPNRVYTIGIIDFLQGYSLGKKLERMSKRLVAADLEISSVSPDVYSERFLDMVSAISE